MEPMRRFLRDESGQDLAEYALLLALIVLVAISSIGSLGTSLATLWTSISGDLATYFGS